jgi:hypothetical protein
VLNVDVAFLRREIHAAQEVLEVRGALDLDVQRPMRTSVPVPRMGSEARLAAIADWE